MSKPSITTRRQQALVALVLLIAVGALFLLASSLSDSSPAANGEPPVAREETSASSQTDGRGEEPIQAPTPSSPPGSSSTNVTSKPEPDTDIEAKASHAKEMLNHARSQINPYLGEVPLREDQLSRLESILSADLPQYAEFQNACTRLAQDTRDKKLRGLKLERLNSLRSVYFKAAWQVLDAGQAGRLLDKWPVAIWHLDPTQIPAAGIEIDFDRVSSASVDIVRKHLDRVADACKQRGEAVPWGIESLREKLNEPNSSVK